MAKVSVAVETTPHIMESRHLLLALLTLAPIAVSAAPAKSPKSTKPAPAKPKPKPAPGAYTKGAGQAVGAELQFGQQFTGKETGFAYKVNGLEYAVGRFPIGADTWIPKAEEKLLLVHFSVKNPDKADKHLLAQHLFQAVTSTGQTIDDFGYARRQSARAAAEDTLKPGQGYEDLMTGFIIPAQATITRLILKDGRTGTKETVTRFEIGKAPNVVKPLAALYADPAVPGGVAPRVEVPAEFGQEYMGGDFNFLVNNVRVTTDAMGEGNEKPEENFRFLTGELTITNGAFENRFLNYGYVSIKALDVNGEEVLCETELLKGTRNENFGADVPGGKSVKVRFYFPVPNDFKLAKLHIAERVNGDPVRPLVFDISKVQ